MLLCNTDVLTYDPEINEQIPRIKRYNTDADDGDGGRRLQRLVRGQYGALIGRRAWRRRPIASAPVAAAAN